MIWLIIIIAFLIAYVLHLKINIWDLENTVLKSDQKEKYEFKSSDHWRSAYEEQYRVNKIAYRRIENANNELAHAYLKLSDARKENEILKEEIKMCCEKKTELCESDAFTLLDQLEKEFEKVTEELKYTKCVLDFIYRTNQVKVNESYEFNMMRSSLQQEKLKEKNTCLEQENSKLRHRCSQLQLNMDDLKIKFNKLNENYEKALKVNMDLHKTMEALYITLNRYPRF